jgi:glycosyltransferase involved in cell wall biosynthesis
LRAKGYTKEIRVIPQFGVPDAFAPREGKLPRRPVTIGYAGRLVREKGIEVLLHALARVEGDWQLRILGSGPLYESIGHLARKLKIGTRVNLTPWVASDEMPEFYNSLDLLIVPSLTQPNWKEQFGRVIMEAMACRVPVIGSDSGEIPNVIGDAGIIVPEGDAVALAQALDTLVKDPQQREALAERGRQRVRAHFSQARVVEETYRLYCALQHERNDTGLL